MSAAEKLKALGEAMPVPFRDLTNGRNDYFSALAVLCAALPQIIALSEAAEKMTNPDGVVRQGDMNFRRLSPDEVLGPALSALEEALS